MADDTLPVQCSSRIKEEVMKRITKIILAVALMVSIAGVAAAQACPRQPGCRAMRQESRIRQGVRAGRLTRCETVRLRHGQRHIRRMELRARADGQVGPRERVRLHRALERQSARIWRLKHNGRAI
jgi:hypothetical protein